MSDFDNTLFKRNVGVLWPQVKYLVERGLPIYIITYRAEDQRQFIENTLNQTELHILGIGFCGSRKKDPKTKFTLVSHLQQRYNIVEALDDDYEAVLQYKSLGIKAHLA